MNTEMYATNDPVVINPDVAQAVQVMTLDEVEALNDQENINSTESTEVESTESESVVVIPEIEFPEDLLTNETYLNGIDNLVNKIDPDSVNEEVYYVDRGSFYSIAGDLPDYAVVYQCNGIDVVFPTNYAEQIYISDGMLVNLGSNYTAGLQIDGYSVSNYLSSEITIPTYHSSTWYQYLQSYGQPYRIVDRYVNNYGSISSSTRNSVSVEWSGGNPWQGFTFDRIAIYLILLILAIMLIFRKGK